MLWQFAPIPYRRDAAVLIVWNRRLPPQPLQPCKPCNDPVLRVAVMVNSSAR
jgi:hypothetical protein